MLNAVLLIIAAAQLLQPASARAASFSHALSELSENHIDKGYQELEAIGPGDPDFVDALVELQKLNFRRGDWQKFFGYALYYRKNVLGAAIGPNFRGRLISLELLALAKHCLFDEARAIGESALSFARSRQLEDAAEIERTMSHLALTRQSPATLRAREQLTRPAPVFTSELLWQISPRQLQAVDHPRDLRVLVAGRCPK